MSEEQAKAIADAVDIIATNRARQRLWIAFGGPEEAAKCAEDAAEAKHLLIRSLMGGAKYE